MDPKMGPKPVLGGLIFHMWSQTSSLAPLLSTFGPLLALQGSILASFGSPFLPPKPQFWDHMVSEILEHQFLEHPSGCSKNLSKLLNTRDVLEIFDNRFLEHRTSHTDMNTSNKLVHTGDVLEFFDNPFLEHRKSHTDMNTSSKLVDTLATH